MRGIIINTRILLLQDRAHTYIIIDFPVTAFAEFRLYKIVKFETPISIESNDS